MNTLQFAALIGVMLMCKGMPPALAHVLGSIILALCGLFSVFGGI